jgi:hypothetical protein
LKPEADAVATTDTARYKDSHRDQAFEESKHRRKAIVKSEPQDIIAIKRLIHLIEITIISATQ